MNWHTVASISKDCIGLSESWQIEVAHVDGDTFAWRTTGDDGDEEEAIDSGSAGFIGSYIIDNARSDETDLVRGLTRIADSRSEFVPLLNAVETQLARERKAEGF